MWPPLTLYTPWIAPDPAVSVSLAPPPMNQASHSRPAAAYLSSATNSVEQLDAQERLVRHAAARDGYTIDDRMMLREERRGADGPIGRDPGRRVLSAFLTELVAGRLTCARLYVADLDRLSRDLLRNRDVRVLLGSYGVAVVTARSPIPVEPDLIPEPVATEPVPTAHLFAARSARIRAALERRRAAGTATFNRSAADGGRPPE